MSSKLLEIFNEPTDVRMWWIGDRWKTKMLRSMIHEKWMNCPDSYLFHWYFHGTLSCTLSILSEKCSKERVGWKYFLNPTRTQTLPREVGSKPYPTGLTGSPTSKGPALCSPFLLQITFLVGHLLASFSYNDLFWTHKFFILTDKFTIWECSTYSYNPSLRNALRFRS